MTNIVTAAAAVLYLLVYVFRTLHYTHMFQLNSYRADRQMRWFSKTLNEYFVSSIPLFLLIAVPFIPDAAGNTAACVLLAAGAVLNRPKKAKKPLVYTARVKRFLITNFVFLAVFIAVCFAIRSKANLVSLLLIALLPAASPFALLLCSYIISPVEKAINRHYVNDAANIIRNHGNLKVIGVTGSYGKTSVKYMLGTLLEAKYSVLITPESYNTPMGVTRTIREKLRATHEIFVCEMGAKQVGDIKEICDIVNPGHGVITSVGPQHLETFKSLDNVKKTKFELADALPSGGKLFLNGEDENIKSYNKNSDAITYGLHPGCTYYADNISVSSKGTSFTLVHGDEKNEFTTQLLGAHNVINIVGAIAVSCEMGVPVSKLPPYVRKLSGVEHRLQLMKRGNMTIIDDAYNSNPAGASAALDVLSLFEGCRIIITPGMIELGDVQEAENKKFGMHIADVCDYVVLVGRKQTESIYEGLTEKGFDKDKIFVADTLQQGADNAFAYDNGSPKTILFENDLPDNF